MEFLSMVSNYEQDIAQSYSQWYQDTTSNSYSNGNSDSSDNSNSYCNSQQNVIKKMMAYQKFNSNYTIVPETTTEASEENKSDGNSETKLTARNIDESLAQDIGVDLEIAFRCLLDKLLQNFTVEDAKDMSCSVYQLLRFSVEFSLECNKYNPMVCRIPFLLIDDILESSTIRKAENVWKVVELLVDKITLPELFAKGKFLVLKMCNALLRRLSKSCNTEFCGRILMFLAAIYPIAERSAVNLSGKVNVGNVTYFEDEETFNATAESMEGLAAQEDMEIQTTNSSSKTTNSKNNGNSKDSKQASKMVVDEEDGEEVEEAASVNEKITYKLYRTFWEFQSICASDKKLTESAASWKDFIEHANSVIKLFERYNASENFLKQSRYLHQQSLQERYPVITNAVIESSASTNSNSNTYKNGVDSSILEAYMGCKFLTSSHLFLLQLQDPLLRQQIAVQILYLVHFLKVKQLPQYLEASIVQLGVNKDNMVTDMLDDLVKLHDRIYELLKATPPNNIEIVNILKRLMYRENYWISWKANGCQAFEKVSSSSKYGSIETYEDNKRRFSDYLYVGKKQKRSRSIASLPKLGEEYAFDNTEENVKDAARNLVQAQPSFARQIEPYEEAEDPEAGIEEEYHPKHDQTYCWQTRRVLAKYALSTFEVMKDGDIGKGLRKLKGSPIDKPVEVSATEEPMEEVVEKETAAEAKDTEEIDLYDIPATTSD